MNEIDPKKIEAAQRRAPGAFKAVFDHYGPMVWRLVVRTTGNDKDLSEEIAQEVFVKMFRSLSSFKGQSAFSTWLHRIAFTTTMSSLSKQHRERKRFVVYDEERVAAQAPPADLRKEVEQLLADLSPEERFLLVAREVDGLSYEDLAAVSGSSAGALRTRLHRLKETIRQGEKYESLAAEFA
jgi:RNA polymerase sigma-70 factor (ECF subfamily)